VTVATAVSRGPRPRITDQPHHRHMHGDNSVRHRALPIPYRPSPYTEQLRDNNSRESGFEVDSSVGE